MTRSAFHRIAALFRRVPLILLVGGSISASAVCLAQTQSTASETQIASQVIFEQRLSNAIPPGLEFVDSTGKPVMFDSLIDDRPAVLVLAYYRCPMLCTLVLNGAVDSLAKVPLQPTKDYSFIVVSIDPSETPELATQNKRKFVDRFDRDVETAGIHFLTGKKKDIDRLADAVGYRYVYDEQSKQFAHPSGIVVLTPERTVSKYFLGLKYPPSDVRLALVEASSGKIGSLVDQVLLLCYCYDPATGKYGLVIANVLRLGGGLTILIFGGLIGVMFWRERRKRRNADGQPKADSSQPGHGLSEAPMH